MTIDMYVLVAKMSRIEWYTWHFHFKGQWDHLQDNSQTISETNVTK